MKIEVLSPHGFCGGVARAIKMAQEALAARGREGNGAATVYCLHEIVHSEQVVQELTAKGMCFVESVDEVPKGAVLLISAHGAPPAVFDAAAARALRVVDPARAEVGGYLGEPGACLPEDVKPNEPVGRVVQTTLDAAAQEGVCTATRDRQRAVGDFVHSGDPSTTGVLVVGSANSSNTARLVDIAREAGAAAWRVDGPDELSSCDFAGIKRLGLTAGASTPEAIVVDISARLGRF